MIELRNNAPQVPVVLVGTKIDLRDGANTGVSVQEGHSLQAKHKFFSFVECSAK